MFVLPVVTHYIFSLTINCGNVFLRKQMLLKLKARQFLYQTILTIKITDIFYSYRKGTNPNMSLLEAHAAAGSFRLLLKGIFNPYVL